MALKQYPKFLSEKSLQKKYAELKMSDEKIDFLKSFILACTNLYGRIVLRDAWEVYKKLSEMIDVPKIRRIDLIRISEVLRREELPYFVYEIDELYEDEKRADLDREFVSGYLIGHGRGKLIDYYQVAKYQCMYDYFLPENLLSFVEIPVSLQEQSLMIFLGKLKVTEEEYQNKYGQVRKCSEHQGETLDSFSFMNEDEEYLYLYKKGEITGNKGNAREAQRLLDENNSMTEAQKIVSRLKRMINIGLAMPNRLIEYVIEELNEVGVLLSEEQMRKLIDKVVDLHNCSHQMCMCGWRPNDLSGIRGMISDKEFEDELFEDIDEELDVDELIEILHSLGMDFTDD